MEVVMSILKTEIVSIRLDKKRYQKLTQLAEANGENLSEYVRGILKKNKNLKSIFN